MNSKSKLAFVGPLPLPLGGVAVMNKSFQDLLRDKYYIIYFNTSKGEEREDLYSKKITKSIWAQLKRIKSFVRFIKNDTNLVCNLFVTSSVGFIREAIFILIMKFYNKKIIVHLHSKKKGEFFLSKYRIYILAYFLNKTDKIILLSNDHYEYFSKYFDDAKITVIENFVDYQLYDCSITDKIKEFLYVGRLSEKKGFFDLLKSIVILKNNEMKIKFNILGIAESDSVEKEIEDFIKENNLSSYLKFHGLKYGKDKYDLFKNCGFFIFPSKFENSPVVLKEAIASNMAIISSDIEANKLVLNVVDEKVYFKVSNSEDLAEKIKNLYQNDKIAFNMMEASQRVKIYDKSIAKKQLISIVEWMENE